MVRLLINKLRNHIAYKDIGSWHSSVIRRSFMLIGLVIPGLLLNFALSILAADQLSAQKFGLFYLGLSIANILAAPSAVLAFYLARWFGNHRKHYGDDAIWAPAAGFFRSYFLYYLIGALVLCGVAVPLASFTNLGSPLLVIVVCFLAASTYLVDAARGILKASQRFSFLGFFGLSWMTGRFLLGLGAIWITGKVWAALFGVMASAILSSIAFYVFLVFKRKSARPCAANLETGNLRATVPFALGYTFAFAIAYLDILVAYILLNENAFGGYSASSILPKGLYTLTLPIMQVMFPTIISKDGLKTKRGVAIQSLFLTLALTGAGAIFVWFGADELCGGRFRIGSCHDEIMVMLVLAIPATSLLRGLVLIKLAERGEMHSLLLFFPLILFIGYEMSSAPSPTRLAFDFMAFSVGTLIYYAFACLIPKR